MKREILWDLGWWVDFASFMLLCLEEGFDTIGRRLLTGAPLQVETSKDMPLV